MGSPGLPWGFGLVFLSLTIQVPPDYTVTKNEGIISKAKIPAHPFTGPPCSLEAAAILFSAERFLHWLYTRLQAPGPLLTHPFGASQGRGAQHYSHPNRNLHLPRYGEGLLVPCHWWRALFEGSSPSHPRIFVVMALCSGTHKYGV